MTVHTDTVIIGPGPSGLFQYFELGLPGIDAHIVDSLPVIGGQCAMLYPDKAIYDIPALPIVGAQELIDRLAEQLQPFDPTYHLGQRVIELVVQADGAFELRTETGTCFHTRTVVIAAGLGAFTFRPLRTAGAEAFERAKRHYHVADETPFNKKTIGEQAGRR